MYNIYERNKTVEGIYYLNVTEEKPNCNSRQFKKHRNVINKQEACK